MDTTEYEIDLKELLHILIKRVWIIVTITVICTAISAGISFFILEPVYETHTTLMVSRPIDEESNINYQDVLLSHKLAKTYGEIIESRTILQKVIDEMKLDKTYEQLGNMVSVTSVKDTEIIKIRVTGKKPSQCAVIANKLATIFKEDVKIIMRVDNVQFIDRAVIPQDPVKPNKMLNIVIAGFLGLFLSFALVLLLEFIDNTMKTETDIHKYLELPVLGTIPEFEE